MNSLIYSLFTNPNHFATKATKRVRKIMTKPPTKLIFQQHDQQVPLDFLIKEGFFLQVGHIVFTILIKF